MTYSGIQLRHLAFHGPNKVPAIVSFGPGLNIIYGASNTGKSFVVEAIDFMLGGKGPLTDIPEANGYAELLLTIETNSKKMFTLRRTIEGGIFRLYDGIFFDDLPNKEARDLAETHSEKSADNLSSFLLELISLEHKKIRKNAKDETQNLSFRNLARLVLINEEEIIQKRSPLSDGSYVADTANTSVFKLLISGVDDSALVSVARRSPEEETREAQISLLEELIKAQEVKINTVSGSRDDLSKQEDKLSAALGLKADQLSDSEGKFRELSKKRLIIFKRIEEDGNRFTEVTTLLNRFRLLRSHYQSDLERLIGIREAGQVFQVLNSESCPVCGAKPEHHDLESVCEGDVNLAVEAATAEIAKIEAKELELSETIKLLDRESKALEKAIPNFEIELRTVSMEINATVAPDLRTLRTSYKQLADKGANVREALGLFDGLNELMSRKEKLTNSNNGPLQQNTVSQTRLTNTMVFPFAQKIQQILSDWKFPNGEQVHFDIDSKDLIISGKPRTSFGKGLRAITQAAFTIGLREYCIESNLPHPGFVILDSPLLSYKEPDGPEDDLRATGLNSEFYNYIVNLGNGSQTIIIENTDPPSTIQKRPQTNRFTGEANSGRFGLFPV